MIVTDNVKAGIRSIFDREPWWAELWSALAAFGWAVISYDSPDSIQLRPAYWGLSMIAGSGFWEFAGALIGLVQFASLMACNRQCRWASAFVASWWWVFLTMAFFQNDPQAPSLALYVVFGAINLFSMVKLARTYA